MLEFPPDSIIVNAHDSSKSGLIFVKYFLYGISIFIACIGLYGATTGKIYGMSIKDGIILSCLGIGFLFASYWFLRYIDKHRKIVFTSTQIMELNNDNKLLRTIRLEDVEFICAIEIIPKRYSYTFNLLTLDEPFNSHLKYKFHKILIETNKPNKGYYPKPEIRNTNSIMVQYSIEIVDFIKNNYPDKIINPKNLQILQ